MKPIGQDLAKISAVYCIYNKLNGFEYIGSTSNLYNRMLKHRALLRHNKHANPNLQKDWNKYGEDAFDYRIVELCTPEQLKVREDYYIKNQLVGYNLADGALHYSFLEDSRRRMSEGRKAGFANGNIQCYQKKKVYKYDLDGNLVAEYDSLKEAAIAENINRSSIKRCLSGIFSQSNGFRWSLTKTESLGKYEKPKHIVPNRYTYIVSDESTVIEFDGCKACAEYFNVSKNSIEQVIRNGNIYRKKYMITKVCRSHE